jgi:hypothetical protein
LKRGVVKNTIFSLAGKGAQDQIKSVSAWLEKVMVKKINLRIFGNVRVQKN